MLHESHSMALAILLVGLALLLALLVKPALERLRIPPLIGYIAIGFLFRFADTGTAFLSDWQMEIFEFLAGLGVVVLLFRVGLESDVPGLLRQLPRAGLIWIANLVLSAFAGYTVARWAGYSLVPCLFTATAFTATSVGVSVAVWQKKNALHTDRGELLIDVAELDDISGVALMAILFALVPVLQSDPAHSLLPRALETGGLFFLKLMGFAILCILFSRYAEKPMTRAFFRISRSPEPMLLVTGVGIIIAAIAGSLGFSLAIGALFAGLVFSRDPEAVHEEARFAPVHDLFAPFFFIGIGLKLEPSAVTAGLGLGLVLLIAATAGKVAGAGLPAMRHTGGRGALLIGLSMVPHAEIAMIVLSRGKALGDWAMPDELFAGGVVMCAGTCLIIPLILDRLLSHDPPS